MLTQEQIDGMSRSQILEWLKADDRNGVYTDADAADEGMQPINDDWARELIEDAVFGERDYAAVVTDDGRSLGAVETRMLEGPCFYYYEMKNGIPFQAKMGNLSKEAAHIRDGIFADTFRFDRNQPTIKICRDMNKKRPDDPRSENG